MKENKVGKITALFLLASVVIAIVVATTMAIKGFDNIDFADHFLLIILWIVFSYFWKFWWDKFIQPAIFEEKINKRYATGGVIQGFAEVDEIMQHYANDIKYKNSPIEVFKLYFSFVVCKTNSKSSWIIDRGDFDSEAYNIAREPYDIQLRQWENTAAIIESNHEINKNEIRHYNKTRPQGTQEKNYPIKNLPPKPSAPNEFDYVTYTKDFGSCQSYLEHKRFISATLHELNSKNFGVLKLNLFDYKAQIENLYGRIFDKIISGECQVNEERFVDSISPFTGEEIIPRLKNAIESDLLSKVKALMGYYDKNPNISNVESEFELQNFKFPIILVVIGANNEKYKYELIDSIDPKFVVAKGG